MYIGKFFNTFEEREIWLINKVDYYESKRLINNYYHKRYLFWVWLLEDLQRNL